MKSTLESFEAMLERGAGYDEIEAYVEAQDHLSRNEKDVLWLVWADSDAPLPHAGSSSARPRRGGRP